MGVNSNFEWESGIVIFQLQGIFVVCIINTHTKIGFTNVGQVRIIIQEVIFI